VSPHDLFSFRTSSRLLYPADVQRPVLALEATHTAHVVSVVSELIAREAVFGGVWQRVGRIRKSMNIFAFPAVGTASPGKEQAAVLDACCVSPRYTLISLNVASCL
jgi:hypothetical protein